MFYRWTSPKALFSLTLLMAATTQCIADLPLFLQKGLTNASSMTTLLLNLHWLTEMLAYIYLARKWPKLIKKWFEAEEIMRKTNNYHSKVLYRKIKIQFVVYVVFTTVEYAIVTIHHIPKDGTFEQFFVKHYPLYAQGNYSLFYAITHQASHTIRFYAVAFNDIFIIIISTALALRFKEISERLKKYGLKATTLSFWTQIRADYTRLSDLCYVTNEHISFLIFTSFANNFQTILFKLFQSINFHKSKLERNFFPHIILAVIKLFATSAYTAWVNDQSKEATIILNRVPAATYSPEIKKLLLQISFDDVALTGLTLFRCTKGLIISIAGALVTYELVLVQFNTIVTSN